VNVALLADFGSTFTKVVAVDLDEGAIVGQSQSPNALDGEILDGYDDAVGAALSEIAPHDRRSAGPAAALRAASRVLQRLITPGQPSGENPAAPAMAALFRASSRYCPTIEHGRTFPPRGFFSVDQRTGPTDRPVAAQP
jgi:hypothetical protein